MAGGWPVNPALKRTTLRCTAWVSGTQDFGTTLMRQIYGVYDGIFEKAEGNWAFPRHLCHVQSTREAAMNPRTWTLGQTRHFHGTACPPYEGSAGFSASPALQYLGNHLSPVVINKDIWLPPVGPLLWHKGWAPAPWGQWKPKNRAKFSLDMANPKLTCRENSLQKPLKVVFHHFNIAMTFFFTK